MEETPKLGHVPIPMKRICKEQEGSLFLNKGKPGDFHWDVGDRSIDIVMVIPTVDGGIPIRLPVITKESNESWYWNRDFDKPTLDESVHTRGKWHGYVRNGMLVETG